MDKNVFKHLAMRLRTDFYSVPRLVTVTQPIQLQYDWRWKKEILELALQRTFMKRNRSFAFCTDAGVANYTLGSPELCDLKGTLSAAIGSSWKARIGGWNKNWGHRFYFLIWPS